MPKIGIKIRTPTIKAKLYRATVGSVAEEYDGEYTVVPKTHEQELDTKNKLMKDNVTVKKIPYHEVSNDTGTTVIIADI